jgi:hypothetical protein
MHQSLGKLKTEARKSATNAGHTMGPFHTIKRATKRTVAEALCVKCGAYVQVDTNPLRTESTSAETFSAKPAPVRGGVRFQGGVPPCNSPKR